MKKSNASVFILVLILVVSSFEAFAQTRIRFARGRTSTSVSGTVGAFAERSYVLGARRGQYLSANISSRNGCVKFGNGATSTSYITSAGNNYLYLSNGCRRATSFTLTVSINYGSD